MFTPGTESAAEEELTCASKEKLFVVLRQELPQLANRDGCLLGAQTPAGREGGAWRFSESQPGPGASQPHQVEKGVY